MLVELPSTNIKMNYSSTPIKKLIDTLSSNDSFNELDFSGNQLTSPIPFEYEQQEFCRELYDSNNEEEESSSDLEKKEEKERKKEEEILQEKKKYWKKEREEARKLKENNGGNIECPTPTTSGKG